MSFLKVKKDKFITFSSAIAWSTDGLDVQHRLNQQSDFRLFVIICHDNIIVYLCVFCSDRRACEFGLV